MRQGKLSLWRHLDRALRVSLPGHCAFCLGTTSAGCAWCQPCFESLPWNIAACPMCAEPQVSRVLVGRRCGHCIARPPAFLATQAPLCYQDEMMRLMQRFKFSASPRAGHVMLELFEQGLPTAVLAWPDALVPVPLHPDRARERGFNQASWLACRLAARHSLPVITARRRQHTRTQRGLDRSERYHNLKHGFEVTARLPPRIALFDDVMTTGATLDALAQACLAAGAQEVQAWTITRTPLARGYAAV